MDKIGEDPELLESVGFAELVEGMAGKGKEETMKERERWMRTERRVQKWKFGLIKHYTS